MLQSALRHQIVVPHLYKPDGSDVEHTVPASVVEDVRLDVIELVGGGTVHRSAPSDNVEELKMAGNVIGIWQADDGSVDDEPVMLVIADGAGSTLSGDDRDVEIVQRFLFRTVAATLARELRQDAVYYVCHEVHRAYVREPGRESARLSSDGDLGVTGGSRWTLVLDSPAGQKRYAESVEVVTLSPSKALYRTEGTPEAGHIIAHLSDRFVERHFPDMHPASRP